MSLFKCLCKWGGVIPLDLLLEFKPYLALKFAFVLKLLQNLLLDFKFALKLILEFKLYLLFKLIQKLVLEFKLSLKFTQIQFFCLLTSLKFELFINLSLLLNSNKTRHLPCDFAFILCAYLKIYANLSFLLLNTHINSHLFAFKLTQKLLILYFLHAFSLQRKAIKNTPNFIFNFSKIHSKNSRHNFKGYTMKDLQKLAPKQQRINK